MPEEIVQHFVVGHPKCLYNKGKLDSFGCVSSAEGVSPDPKRDADQKASSELRRLHGLARCCGRFVSNLAIITHP